MKIMLLAAFLLALIVPVRAEDKPAAGGENPEIKAERQEFIKEMKAEQEHKQKKAEVAAAAAPAPAAK